LDYSFFQRNINNILAATKKETGIGAGNLTLTLLQSLIQFLKVNANKKWTVVSPTKKNIHKLSVLLKGVLLLWLIQIPILKLLKVSAVP